MVALLHFLMVECLPIYAFYFSAKSVLCTEPLIMDLLQGYLDSGILAYKDVEAYTTWGSRSATIHEQVSLIRCANANVWETTDLDSCVRSEFRHTANFGYGTQSRLTVAHYGVLVLCGILVLWGLVLVIKRCGLWASFGKGAYLKAAWELEQGIVYRATCGLLVLGMAAMFADEIYVVQAFYCPMCLDTDDTYHLGWINAVKLVFRRYMVQLLVMVISIIKMVAVQTPSIDWQSSGFGDYTFSRGWLDMVIQSNDAFGHKLVNALWASESGECSGLNEIMASPADKALVQQLCKAKALHGPADHLELPFLAEAEAVDVAKAEADAGSGGGAAPVGTSRSSSSRNQQ